MFTNTTIAKNVMYVNIETIVETVANTVTFQFAISIIIFTSVEGHAIHVFLVQLWLAGLEILEHRVKMFLGEVKPASGVVTQVIVDGCASV